MYVLISKYRIQLKSNKFNSNPHHEILLSQPQEIRRSRTMW